MHFSPLTYPKSYKKYRNPATAAAIPKYRNVNAVDPVIDIKYPPIRLPLPKVSKSTQFKSIIYLHIWFYSHKNLQDTNKIDMKKNTFS